MYCYERQRKAEEMFQIKGNRKHDNQMQYVMLDSGGEKNAVRSVSDKTRKCRIENL